MNGKKKFTSFLLAGAIMLLTVPALAADTKPIETVQVEVTYGQTEARTMLDMVNDFRTGDDAWALDASGAKVPYSGLNELVYDYNLEKAAMQRAAEIALSFAHTRPNGTSCATLIYGDGYVAYGENIAAGYSTAKSVFNGWLETNENFSGQGHRRNMLGRGFSAIGIGHAIYNGVSYWVQEFGTPSSNTSATPADDSKQLVDVDVLLSDAEVSIEADPDSLTIGTDETADLPVLDIALQMADTWGASRSVFADYTWTVEEEEYAVISDDTVTGIQEGMTALTTTVLGKTISIPLNVHDHVYNSGTVTVLPTCTQDGVRTYKCTKCDDSYTETMKALGHNYVNGICSRCHAEEPNCPLDAFIDVEKGMWYHDGVHYALENELMIGTKRDIFEPNQTLTRAMVAQILYKSADSPSDVSVSPFSDVKAADWYFNAVTWAAEQGIVSGYASGNFGPNDNVTREQLATMLYSAAKKPDTSSTLNFADTSDISDWAYKPMAWAVEHDIISGMVQNHITMLHPQGTATRAQAAVMVMKYLTIKT